jgi:hypothetical protein
MRSLLNAHELEFNLMSLLRSGGKVEYDVKRLKVLMITQTMFAPLEMSWNFANKAYYVMTFADCYSIITQFGINFNSFKVS